MFKRIFQSTSLKANIASNFIGNAWISTIGLLFVPIYLKYIGAEAYGLIGIFGSLQVVLSLLDSGLSTTLNKEIATLSVLPGTEQKLQNIVKTLGSVYWIAAIAAGIIAIIISPVLAKYWVHSKELSVTTITYAFILLSLNFIFQFPISLYSGGLLGLHRQVVLNTIKVVFATAKSFGALLLFIFVSKSVLVFFGWTLVVTVLQVFTQKFFLWYYLPKATAKAIFDKKELKAVWRFAAGMAAVSLTAILLTQIDKIILSKMLSLEQFGYYTIACSLGMMITQVLGPITQSYFPKLANLISLNKQQELKNIYHQACQLKTVLVIPATVMLVVFSKELIFIWTKNPVTVENTWLVTAIYAFGVGMNGLMHIPYLLTVANGWTRFGFYVNLCMLVLMVPLTIFLALQYGTMGGALSWAILNTVYFFFSPILIHKNYLKGEAFNWYWKDTLLPAIGTIAIILAAKFCLFNRAYNNITEFILLITVGIIAVFASTSLASQLRPAFATILKKGKF